MSYAIVLEILEDGEWTTVRLWDNADAVDERSGDRETMAGVMSHDANIDPATERVLAGIEDEDLAARYPDRAHFISADNPIRARWPRVRCSKATQS